MALLGVEIMESIKKEVLIYLMLGLMLLIWVSVLQATGTPLSINWEAIKKLPDVVTIFVILSFVFTRWMWRWKMFTYKGWLVKVPYIHRTSAGGSQSPRERPKTSQR